MEQTTFPLIGIARHRMGIDGSGITTLVAGAGCPLQCKWCINQKLLQEAPVRHVTAQQLLELVKKDDLYYRATGGGITFGGGESLLHADFIRAFRQICPSEWRISVETSLCVPETLVAAAADAADMFIIDCKDMNAEIYKRYTGGDPSLMMNNLRYLLERTGPEQILVRVPLIPEYNTETDQEVSRKILLEMGVKNLDLFKYVCR
ncbi:MAG TPA: radical SAM protein [Lachnospiraceae bacterium]|nr:radical SAM protein [Lachnospiraceae bacterium]